MTFEVVEDGTGIDAALEQGLRIEAAGWKAREGTAMASRPDTLRFYSTFAHRAASRGWLRLHFLAVGGRPIAFSYCLCFGKTVYLVKQGYDQAFGPYSPGTLHAAVVLKDAFDRGMGEFDFLGDDDPWKLEWTATTRAHRWLFIFADRLKPRIAHTAKFRISPRLRPLRAHRADSERDGDGR